ncbi:uncharacterized protein TNCV_368791 [Trichonephila clavipes]|nr:uncharacterized protein TNCV_368791 [Trichonephila clavipes]
MSSFKTPFVRHSLVAPDLFTFELVKPDVEYMLDWLKVCDDLAIQRRVFMKGKPLPVQFTILDRDSPSVNNITIRKSDPLHLFNLKDPVIFHGIHGGHMLMNTVLVPKPQFQFPDSSYNVSVIFSDVSLVNSDESGQIVFNVVISNSSLDATQPSLPPDEFQVVTNLFRHSAHHTRVVQPMEVKPHEGFFFRLIRDPNQRILSNKIFGVTPKTGIVYILDEVALSRSTNKLFRLELTWRNRNVTDRRCIILVRVLDSGEPRTECALETINTRFPPEEWLHIYTDGSLLDFAQGAGIGVFSHLFFYLHAGPLTTHFDGEVEAIHIALQKLAVRLPPIEKAVILSDSTSALQALSNYNENNCLRVQNCRELLGKIKGKIVFQWVPSHCGLWGNERADFFGKKKGTGILQNFRRDLTLHSAKLEIKRIFRESFRLTASRVARDKPWSTLCKKSHGIPSSPRAAAVAKFRLLTGHDCLCAHLFRFNLVTSPICVLCDTGQDMTAAHLDECSALNDLNCIVKRSLDFLNPQKIKSHKLRLGEGRGHITSPPVSTIIRVEPGHKFPSCAKHGNPDTCTTSCGRGANGGYCQWRSQSFPTLTEEYATCSPNLLTCPDGICDELEELDPLLCPQDCAAVVHGQAIPGLHEKGIGKAAAPCICNEPKVCVCHKFFPLPKPASRSQTKTYKETPNIKSRPLELSEIERRLSERLLSGPVWIPGPCSEKTNV